MSLRKEDSYPALQDPARPYGLSVLGEHFAAGILDHMPALAAITTPTVCSYYRLMPDRWAPTWANLSSQDRAASLRICPGLPSAFNLEYRVADATANPYLALGALIHAGLDGIENKLSLPAPPEKAFSAMTDVERRAAGMKPLPRTLDEALDNLRDTAAAKLWFGPEFLDLYLDFKRQEIQTVAGLDPQTICDRYAAIF